MLLAKEKKPREQRSRYWYGAAARVGHRLQLQGAGAKASPRRAGHARAACITRAAAAAAYCRRGGPGQSLMNIQAVSGPIKRRASAPPIARFGREREARVDSGGGGALLRDRGEYFAFLTLQGELV